MQASLRPHGRCDAFECYNGGAQRTSDDWRRSGYVFDAAEWLDQVEHCKKGTNNVEVRKRKAYAKDFVECFLANVRALEFYCDDGGWETIEVLVIITITYEDANRSGRLTSFQGLPFTALAIRQSQSKAETHWNVLIFTEHPPNLTLFKGQPRFDSTHPPRFLSQ